MPLKVLAVQMGLINESCTEFNSTAKKAAACY